MKRCELSLWTVLSLALFGLTASPAISQDVPFYKQQTIHNLDDNRYLSFALSRNYRKLDSGLLVGYVYLGSGSYQDARIYMEAGYDYVVLGACDNDCTDLDFTLYDPDGNKVAQDTAPNDTPVIQLVAPRTGLFTVRATIPSCKGLVGCYWAVQTLGK
jgi:hypothetical protein